MKKLLFVFTLMAMIFAFSTPPCFAGQPPTKAKDAAKVQPAPSSAPTDTGATKTNIFDQFPDSTVFVHDGQAYVIRYTDAQDLANQTAAIVEAAKGMSLQEILTLLFGLLVNGTLLQYFVKLRKVGGQFISFFGKQKSPINFIIAGSGIVAAAITYFVKGLDVPFFLGTWGGAFGLAILVWEKWLKPKPTEPQPA